VRRTWVLLLGLLAATAVLATACEDDDAADNTTAVDHGAMLAALNTLELSELHHVNVMLVSDDPMIDPAWLAPLRHARLAVAATTWPDELQAAADEFLSKSMPLEMAIANDDLEQASAVATDAHTAWHMLKDPAYQYIAEAIGFEIAEDDMSGMSMSDDNHD